MQLKRIVERLKQATFEMFIAPLLFIISVIFTTVPLTFIRLEVGRFVGPYLAQGTSILILLAIVVCIPLFSYLISIKLKKNKAEWIVVLSLIMSFLILFSFSLAFMQAVSAAGKKIDTFIAKNENLDFLDYVINVSSFLNSSVQIAYNRPEVAFKIDEDIYGTLLGPSLINFWGATRADVIVYQGWGTCGEAAILIEELLHDAGYEARQAKFKDIDHQWAEVKFNGTWLIVDPWYVGNFVEIQNLKNAKPAFQAASGVWVIYDNGTIVDSSYEHGY